MVNLTVGSLFSGIGGFDLALQNLGMEIKWQIENDPYCTKILEYHFPNMKKYGDIKNVDPENLEYVDVITGGVPCQPYSYAGARKGSSDERYLWPETIRIICAIRPKWVILENVRGLLTAEDGKVFSKILSGLASCGYNAEWQVLSARAFGAPHKRDRVFIVAYPERKGLQRPFFEGSICCEPSKASTEFGNRNITCGSWWLENIANIRMGDGIPLRLARHRVKAYGNAVCPQIIEFIGKRILELEKIKEE